MGRWSSRGLVAIAAFVAAGPAAPEARPVRIWARPQTAVAVTEADFAACVTASKTVQVPVAVAGDYGASQGLGGVVGTLIAEAIVSAVEQPVAERRYTARCMRTRHYVGVPLTAEESARYRALKTPEQAIAWRANVYAAEGFADRLSAAGVRRFPLAPEAEAAPLTLAGVRFDPAALKPSDGVQTEGSVLLGGPIGHRLTGRLGEARDFAWSPLKIHLDAGTVVHQQLIDGDDGDVTAWCGPGHIVSALGVRRSPMVCVRGADDGYRAYEAVGRPWLAAGSTLANDPTFLGFKTTATTMPIEPSGEDLVGGMDFALKLTKLGKTSVTLDAVAMRDGQSVTFWSGELPIDPSGKVSVPFWSHRLILTRLPDGKALTVTFTADGDGNPLGGGG